MTANSTPTEGALGSFSRAIETESELFASSSGGQCAAVQVRHDDWLVSGGCAAQVDLSAETTVRSPPLNAELQQWILRVVRASHATIRKIFFQQGIPPVPERSQQGAFWYIWTNSKWRETVRNLAEKRIW